MATTEHTINDALASLLRETRRAWRASNVVSSENTGMLVGSNKRPDILVVEPSVSPVAIETEVAPAITVECETIARLGENVRTNGRLILSSIALRLPERLKKRSGASLQKELTTASDFEMALYTGGSPEKHSRWPQSGWLAGGVADLSILTQSASVPPDLIDQAANQLVEGVSEAAGLLGELAHDHPGAMQEICKELRQHDDEQTRRMATTILANAFVFQESLARGPGELSKVLSVEELRGSGTLTRFAVLNEWRKILEVNYWPIFDIARRILEVIPAGDSKLLIQGLAATADRLSGNTIIYMRIERGIAQHRHGIERGLAGRRLVDLGQGRKEGRLDPLSLLLLLRRAGTNVVPPEGTCRVREDLNYRAALRARQPKTRILLTATLGAGVAVAGYDILRRDCLGTSTPFTSDGLQRRVGIDRPRLLFGAQEGLAVRQYPLIVEFEFFVTVAATTLAGESCHGWLPECRRRDRRLLGARPLGPSG